MILSLLLVCLLVCGSSQSPRRGPRTYEKGKIYVHVVPHTHDDVGWLKTVDEYYYGGNRNINGAAVKYILDSVIEELQKNEERTFIYVEIAFFSRWWNQQSEATKEIVKRLVSKKQLEFVNGGWCMNDEASTHYNAIIDQMTLGLQFIEENFGADARPRVAWHIDPFGHSSTQAALFASMGFDGFFFGRQDYDDHILRKNRSTLEMVWKPSKSLGESADLFTGVLYDGYNAPYGFCFDIICQDYLVQDDPNLDDYNVQNRSKLFLQRINEYLKVFSTNHIMFTMGSDFQYMNAKINYDSMDEIIKSTMMMNSSIEIFYSTPSQYLDALHSVNKVWTTKTDDFFPYADRPYSYWTGYFTSRPALKGYVRKMNSLLQSCFQIEAFAGMEGMKSVKSAYSSETLREAMGVSQHHDAVSGTEKQHVADDYAKRLHKGAIECHNLSSEVLGAYLSSATQSPPPLIEVCEELNVSVCPVSETNSFNLIVYNPIGRSTPHIVVVPVTSTELEVFDGTGTEIEAMVYPVSEAVARVRGKRGSAPYEIYFRGILPPLGFNTYFIRPKNSFSKTKTSFVKSKPVNVGEGEDDIILTGKDVSVGIDGTTGRLKFITTNGGLSLKIDQNFYWYNSSNGNNTNSTQTSGAYIFRPNGTAAWNVSDNTVKINHIKGPLFEEVQQTFSDWVQQNIRVHNDGSAVEFDYIIGPIPINDDLGKEVITRFTSSAQTGGTWYTDSNGREMQKRVRNFRPTWKLNVTEPVAGNYYPVNSRMFMQYEDEVYGSSQFTIMTDRSQGGASLNDGELELMIHRRTLYDDFRGVGEPINETGLDGKGLIIRGVHIVSLNNVENSTAIHRLVGEAMMLTPYHAFIRDTGSVEEWRNKYPTSLYALNSELPLNVHLLTFMPMKEGKILIRLEHQFEAHETPWNKPVTVSLTDLFTFKVMSVTELGLAANTDPVTRLKWNTDSKGDGRRKNEPVVPPDFNVDLQPMQIRTFVITSNYSQ